MTPRRNWPRRSPATRRPRWPRPRRRCGARSSSGLTDACKAGAQELVSMWGHPDQEEGPRLRREATRTGSCEEHGEAGIPPSSPGSLRNLWLAWGGACGARAARPQAESGNNEREDLYPRVHRHHRAQPREVHAPHDRELVPHGTGRAQHAVLRRVGHRRLDRSVAGSGEHVGARTVGTGWSRTSRTSCRRRRCRIPRSPSGGPRRPTCGAVASTASACRSRGARRSRSSRARA